MGLRRNLAAVARPLYRAFRAIVLALLRIPLLIARGLAGLVRRVTDRIRIRSGDYLRAIANAYRQGPFVLMLKIVRWFPVAIVSWIEAAYFALGRARDLTFIRTNARVVTLRMSGEDRALRNLYIVMARILERFKWEFDQQAFPHRAGDIESDVPSPVRDGDPKRKSAPSRVIELNVLLGPDGADVGRIQSIAQMGRPIIKDLSVYFDENSLRHDMPTCISEVTVDPQTSLPTLDALNVDNIPPEWLVDHFLNERGTQLVEPDTAIAHTGSAFTGFTTSTSSATVVLNLAEGGIRNLDEELHRDWRPMIQSLLEDEEMFGRTTFVVINAALSGGLFETRWRGNVVLSSALGLTYPDIVALLDQADCYIGVYDYHGAAVPGRPTAALLFPASRENTWPQVPDRFRTVEGARAVRGERQDQLLLLDHPSPELIARMVRRAVRNSWRWE